MPQLNVAILSLITLICVVSAQQYEIESIPDIGIVPSNISSFFGRNIQISGRESSETIISFNPKNSQVLLASSNFFYQEDWTVVHPAMYYSHDGGITWKEAFFPDSTPDIQNGTVGDPTAEWSSDGSIAYSATLAECYAGCAMWFYRSYDMGATWHGPTMIDGTENADKPMIHVDKSPQSPHKDNIYIIYDLPIVDNVQIFGKSTDHGLTWKNATFTSQFGVGGDLTSDKYGKIYYVFPSLGAEITIATSTDGGETWSSFQNISAVNISFQMALPANNVRGVLIYTAIDTDKSNGPHSGNVYVVWSDTWNDENGMNHGFIIVGSSKDGGKTWKKVVPHTLDDIFTVDRFFPWLAVDENGRVHVSFFDTRNWMDRSGTDVYYTYSDDGGQTWVEPIRITSASSGNVFWDEDQLGDYEGLAAGFGKVMPIWADNRNMSGPVTIWTGIVNTTLLEHCTEFDVAFAVKPYPVKPGKVTTFTAIVKGGSGKYKYEWNFSSNSNLDCDQKQCQWNFAAGQINQASVLVTDTVTGCYKGATAFV